MTDRAPVGTGPGKGSTAAPNAGSRANTARPRPCNRTMRGGPENAQNINTIRSLSPKWATVSIPEPVRSR